MGFMDSMKAAMAEADKKAKEQRVTLNVTSGGKFLNLGLFSSSIVMRQNAEGAIYFDNVQGTFEIIDYVWEGPAYKSVTTETEVSKNKGKAKTKNKGGLGGAVVGTILLPGVGTAIGYAATRKKVTKGKGQTTTNTTAETHDEEVPAPAKITFKNKESGETFVVGITCDSKLDGEIANFNMKKTANIAQHKSSVEQLKEYKELLDLGIITQDEFNQKKAELLGL